MGSSLTFDHLLIEEDGDYTLRIEKTQTDTGFAELDAFDLLPCSLTGAFPSLRLPKTMCDQGP